MQVLEKLYENFNILQYLIASGLSIFYPFKRYLDPKAAKISRFFSGFFHKKWAYENYFLIYQ
jgi:hypothetical protein